MGILPKKKNGADLLAEDLDISLKKLVPGYIEKSKLAALESIDPPLNNMGGNLPDTPYFLPQYEIDLKKLATFESRSDISKGQKTSLDWLGFSFRVDSDEVSGITALECGLKAIWPDVVITSSGAGMRGYPKCKAVMVHGVQYGLVGYGAKHGRDSVSLTGVACKSLSHDQMALMYDLLQILQARLSRVDICLDLYHGEMTWDYAVFAYERGDFKSKRGGTNPKKRIVTEDCGSGRNLGRTLYIGARDGEVMGRIYEKGLEVFARLPEEFREACTEREEEYYRAKGLEVPTGTIADDWLRLEAEYKYKDKDRLLPLEMLLERDMYFAGAYPFFASALGLTDGVRPKTMKSDTDVSLEKMIQELRRSYGNTVYSLTQLGFTPDEIVEFVSTGTHNKKLVKGGILAAIQADQAYQEAMREKHSSQCDQDDDVPF